MAKLSLKFIFAALLIYWLTASGKIDFSLIPKSLQAPENWAMGIGLLIISVILTAWRWKWLIESTHPFRLSYLRVLKITWIGLLFNTVLPGAVTGDLVKVFYAKNLSPDLKKSSLLATVFMDRILGLIGMIFLMGISSLIFFTELKNSHLTENLLKLNLLLFAGILIFAISLILPQKLQNIFLTWISQIPRIGHHGENFLRQIWALGKSRITLFKAISITLLSQTLNILSFWVLSHHFFQSPLSLKYFFTFVPIGFVSIAIPLTPSGLGIGHAVFDKLFSLFSIEGGASFFNLFFIALTTTNLMGIFPYLTEKKINLVHEDQIQG